MAKKKKPTAKGKERGKGGVPPKDTRFKKGTSGNNAGRPKGSKNVRTYLMEAGRGPVEVTINGKKKTISKIQATTMQLANKAAGGNQAAINKLLDWIDEIETRAAAARPAQFPMSAPDLEVLRAAYERMKQCEPEDQEDQKDSDEPRDNPEGSTDSEDPDLENPED
jgi:hypothetical protein